jgi:large subunit ribosomal protein L24|tara:strand:- start:419 stop:730 length:312 start_codon:yes stop_codon:yes gene_type:complete
MSSKLKKNDAVIVRSGKDKGKEGKIIKMFTNGKAIVEGINISTKHVSASSGAKQTGIVQQESPIHTSNLIFKDPDSGKAGRVKMHVLKDGTVSRIIASSKEGK